MIYNQIEVGQRIKELRILKGVTQEQRAGEVNVSYEHMNKIERGRNGCSIELLLELSAFFGVSTDYLLTGQNYVQKITKKRLQSILDDLTVVLHSMD